MVDNTNDARERKSSKTKNNSKVSRAFEAEDEKDGKKMIIMIIKMKKKTVQ